MRRQGPNDDMSSNDYSLEQPLKQVRTAYNTRRKTLCVLLDWELLIDGLIDVLASIAYLASQVSPMYPHDERKNLSRDFE